MVVIFLRCLVGLEMSKLRFSGVSCGVREGD